MSDTNPNQKSDMSETNDSQENSWELSEGNQKVFYGLVVGSLVIIAALASYYYAASKYLAAQSAQSANSELTKTQPTVAKKDNDKNEGKNLSITRTITAPSDKAVSFAEINGTLYLKYRDQIFNDSDQMIMPTVTIQDSNQYKWQPLVEAPDYVNKDGTSGYDELFSFKIAPDKKHFMFVMRWSDDTSETSTMHYEVYNYNPDLSGSVPQDNVKKLNLFPSGIPTDDNAQLVPKIETFDKSGDYVAFDMFGCWNCGGHKPEKLLMRLSDGATKNIGKISYFTWKENGNYDYKDYVVITCTEEGPGECSEDPATLPLKEGTF